MFPGSGSPIPNVDQMEMWKRQTAHLEGLSSQSGEHATVNSVISLSSTISSSNKIMLLAPAPHNMKGRGLKSHFFLTLCLSPPQFLLVLSVDGKGTNHTVIFRYLEWYKAAFILSITHAFIFKFSSQFYSFFRHIRHNRNHFGCCKYWNKMNKIDLFLNDCLILHSKPLQCFPRATFLNRQVIQSNSKLISTAW